MGWDPYEDSELSNLPAEAWGNVGDVDGPFEPDDQWLRTASEEHKLVAMREWFLARYCDPAHETPYNGREGGYLYIHGGPYNPDDELSTRFSGIVEDELVNQVASELVMDVGDEWAPIQTGAPHEFDERFDLESVAPAEPLKRLTARIAELRDLSALQTDPHAQELVFRLCYSQLISVLESFLWETAQHWIEAREDVLQRCIERLPEFKETTIALSAVFEHHSKIKETMKGYLQNLVWHRWDKVGRLYREGLDIRLPSVKPFEEPLVLRHHIVHRSGTDMNGVPLQIGENELRELAGAIVAFATQVAEACEQRFDVLSDNASFTQDF